MSIKELPNISAIDPDESLLDDSTSSNSTRVSDHHDANESHQDSISATQESVYEVHLLAKSTNAAAIAMSETWLNDLVTDTEVRIPGYNIECHDRNMEKKEKSERFYREKDGIGVCI